jgi:hypothetical protein
MAQNCSDQIILLTYRKYIFTMKSSWPTWCSVFLTDEYALVCRGVGSKVRWTNLNPQKLIQHMKSFNLAFPFDTLEDYMKRVSDSCQHECGDNVWNKLVKYSCTRGACRQPTSQGQAYVKILIRKNTKVHNFLLSQFLIWPNICGKGVSECHEHFCAFSQSFQPNTETVASNRQPSLPCTRFQSLIKKQHLLQREKKGGHKLTERMFNFVSTVREFHF